LEEEVNLQEVFATIAQFVSMLIIALKGSQETATQVTAIIMAGAAVIAYVIGEGLTDAASAKAQSYDYQYYPQEEQEEDPENQEGE